MAIYNADVSFLFRNHFGAHADAHLPLPTLECTAGLMVLPVFPFCECFYAFCHCIAAVPRGNALVISTLLICKDRNKIKQLSVVGGLLG